MTSFVSAARLGLFAGSITNRMHRSDSPAGGAVSRQLNGRPPTRAGSVAKVPARVSAPTIPFATAGPAVVSAVSWTTSVGP